MCCRCSGTRSRTIREVAAILDRRNQDAYYATVKKLLERLDAQGFVSREPRDRVSVQTGRGSGRARRPSIAGSLRDPVRRIGYPFADRARDMSD